VPFGWSAIVFDRFFEKNLCCNGISLGPQQKINGIALAINGTIQIDPFVFQFDVRLVHPPFTDFLRWRTRPLINFANRCTHLCKVE
jgi:hypothetical protein